MDIDSILRTALHMKEHRKKSAAKNFFLLLDFLDYDASFYQLVSLFPESLKNILLTSVIKLLADKKLTEEQKQADLVKILNEAYKQVINVSNIKQIKNLRRAIYQFGVKHDLELAALLQGTEEVLKRKRTVKNFIRHTDLYQNFEEKISKQSDWVKLATKLDGISLSTFENFLQPQSGRVEGSNIIPIVSPPAEPSLLFKPKEDLLPTLEPKDLKKVTDIYFEGDDGDGKFHNKDQLSQGVLRAVNTFNTNKDKMEKYLEAVQKMIASDKSISLEDAEDVKKMLLKLYHKHKISQDISIIDKAIRQKGQANTEHYDTAFKEIKNTLDTVIGYRLVFIKVNSLPDVDELKKLSEQNNNNPILISYNGTFQLYGYGAGNVWRHTFLDQKAFDKKITQKNKPPITIREYLNDPGLNATLENPVGLKQQIKYKLYSKLKKAHTLDGRLWKTALKARSPKLFSDTPNAWEKGLDYGFYQIIDLLANLGLYKQLEGFKTIVNHLAQDQTLSNLERMQRILDAMYGLFNSLSVLEDKNGNLCVADEHLKQLKKLIHAFAEKHHFEKKLFNLYKFYNNKNAVDAEISQSLHHTPNRKYAYIDNLAQQLTQQKVNLRQRKKVLNYISTGASIAVGIGEGVIAAVFFGLFPWSLLIGLAGFTVNYVLFRNDSYHTLKEFFGPGLFRDIFKDANGNEVSFIKKVATTLALISVIGASIAFSFFTFASVLTFITLTVAFPPLAFVLAVGFALAMFVCNTGVFYRITSDFIKNDRIVKIGQYLKSNFYDIFKAKTKTPLGELMSWSDLNTGQKVKHAFRVAGKLVFNIIFTLLMVGVCATITAATLGLGYKYSYSILASLTNLHAKIIHLASAITIYGIASPANSFFYWKGNIAVVNAVKSAFEWVGSKFGKWGETISKAYKAFNANQIRRVNTIISMVQTGMFVGLAVFNGIGQGSGAAHTAQSINFVQKVWQGFFAPMNVVLKALFSVYVRVNQYAAKLITNVAAIQSSFAVNAMAGSSELKVTSTMKKLKTEKSPAKSVNPLSPSRPAVPVVPKQKTRNDVSFAVNYFAVFGEVGKRPNRDKLGNPNPDKVANLISVKKDGMLGKALKKKK